MYGIKNIRTVITGIAFSLTLFLFVNGFRISNHTSIVFEPTDSIYQFDSSNSHIYRFENERVYLLQNTFFNDIKSYPASFTSLKKRSTIADSVQNTYLQVSTFKGRKLNVYYFMIVNRRCAPYRPDSNDNGGRRYIRIKFDALAKEFSKFDDWKITDIYNKKIVKELSNDDTSYINLKWFMPCEGKLYKVSPSD